MTDFIKKSELENKWFHIDATNVVVGRLAAEISKILRGKNKATFTPNMDNGDFVVVTNVEKIKFTGSKYTDKKYYKHTGYPGGIKSTTPEKILKSKFPERILQKAIRRMMPSGPLSNKQFNNLMIYSGEEHPHVAQKPEIIDFKDINNKNIKR
mgnify:CR=1 FL=1